MTKHILFDFDGTIMDTSPGITGGVARAFEHFNRPVPSMLERLRFIGPPLHEAFCGFHGFTAQEAEEAIRIFQAYYTKQGVLECSLYPNIIGLLEALKSSRKTLHVATTKPTVFANQIIARFGIAEYFKTVEGSPLDHSGVAKGLIIKHVMEQNSISPNEAIMVGDRHHDVTGAKENRLPSVAVLYGFGGRKEFEEAGADHIVATVPELEAFLLQLK